MANKETLSIIKEWKQFVSLNEASHKDLEDYLESINNEGYEIVLNTLKNRASELGNLQDTYFNTIIINTFNANEAHGAQEYIDLYNEYITNIKGRNTTELNILLQDGSHFNLAEKLDFSKHHNHQTQTATYQDIVTFLTFKREESKFSSKKTQKILDKELANSSSGSSQSFDKVYEDNNWIIFYPKLNFGSKAIARSVCVNNKLVYDGTAATGNGKLTGKMTWCTASEGINAFLSYKQGNVHLYYGLKKYSTFEKVIENKDDPTRKFCMSYVKKDDRIEFGKGHVCVDSNNLPRDIEWFKSTLGHVFDEIKNDALSSVRKDFDIKKFASSISFEQFLAMRRVNEENLDGWSSELQLIIKHSYEKEKIIAYSCHDTSVHIRKVVARSINEIEKQELKEYVIEELFEDEDNIIKEIILKFISKNKETLTPQIKERFESLKTELIEKKLKTISNAKSKSKFSTAVLDITNLNKYIDYDEEDVYNIRNLIIEMLRQGSTLTIISMKHFLWWSFRPNYTQVYAKLRPEDQILLASSLAKTDYDSQMLFLRYKHITKEVYLYMIRKTLPRRGMGPGYVYKDIHGFDTTYKMLEDPAIASEFIELASKAVLNNILSQMYLIFSPYLDQYWRGCKPTEQSMITFYNAISNSQKGMSIKKNRKRLEKALRQNNLIESFKNQKSNLILERYIKELLSCKK